MRIWLNSLLIYNLIFKIIFKNNKFIMNFIKIRFYLIFIVLFFQYFISTAFSNQPFIINSDNLKIIPYKHFEFLEGFDESVSFSTLENQKWSKKIKNVQSMVDGYWLRFSTVNNLTTNTIGLSHNYNKEKKLFVKNSLGIKEYDFWKSGLNKLITDERIGAQHRIVMPKGELTVIYDFFRNNPVDRFNSKENYHRMMIGSWEELRFREIARFVGRIAFLAPALLFGLYYFFVFLISRGNYIWISLALIMTSLMTLGPLSSSFSGLNLNPSFSSLSGLNFYLTILFLILIQFFKKTLKLNEFYPKLNRIFLMSIFFYIFMSLINLYLLINWPNEEQLNLIKYPPDNLGPGLIKMHIMIIPFIIILLCSIVVSFFSWRKGDSSSGYLCLSFLLPFLILPISFITFLMTGGFNAFFWGIIMPLSGILFLGMFVTFGFSVAQNMKDLEHEFLENQVRLNEELESKVKQRTLELTEANQLITESINSASLIQNAILPKIERENFGFNEFEYLWEPRDIVGGDFYWMDKKDEWTCFVMADCTGHGIPGAFMTLISSTLLDRIKSLEDLSQPERILNQLDELLEETLKLKENDATNFGMDAGVCCFSRKNNKLLYSGAKMNLYHKFDNDVQEYKGDKISLGYSQKPHPIVLHCHHIDFPINSSFFMFSDGITDQVGGPKNIMYGKKRILKIISETSDVKNSIQKITKDLESYQRSHKRRDDLSLFGFSIA